MIAFEPRYWHERLMDQPMWIYLPISMLLAGLLLPIMAIMFVVGILPWYLLGRWAGLW